MPRNTPLFGPTFRGEGRASPAAPNKDAAAPESRGGRVLLVEDHAPTRVALERLLVRRKFVVT
ncbi:MAG TPA: response regulator, partial [Opitutaceae bacterium]